VLAASGAGKIPHLSSTVTSYPPSSSIHNAVDIPKMPRQAPSVAHWTRMGGSPEPIITALTFASPHIVAYEDRRRGWGNFFEARRHRASIRLD